MTSASFYRRPLPETQVPFAGTEGRKLFREALAAGTMEGYFAQAEQFHTQQEPAFCGLATLVVALNALAIDPGRLWKGPWRWYSEELLDCCAPLGTIKEQGITFDQFTCLARCNGATARPTRARCATVDDFRSAILSASETAEGEVLAVCYTRRVLGQTGDGHFSTIAGFHRERDLALVMDVARFKYPPHWVPVSLLYDAMLAHDPVTKKSRGWITLRRGKHPPLAYRLCVNSASWQEITRAFEAVAGEVRVTPTIDEALRTFFATLPSPLAALIERQDADSSEHEAMVCAVGEALRTTEIDAAVRRVRGRPDEVATVLVLIAPDRTFEGVPGMEALRALEGLPEVLASEIARLREQLGVMSCGA
jgi:glutathione gamma-glutamylcysteinyltransferase